MAEASADLTLMIKAEDRTRPAMEQAQASMGRLEKSAGASRAAFMALGGAVAGTVVGALSDMARAAAEEEVTFARLEQALANTTDASAAHASAVEGLIEGAQQLSFADDEAAVALANLANATGSSEEAMKRLPLAMNLARGAGISLEQASKLLGKVTDENVNVLKRYGIQVEKGADSTELLGEVQRRFGGQAEAYANTTQGGIDRIRNAIDNWKESIGGALGPAQGLLMMLPGLQQGATLAGGAIGFLGAHSKDLGGGLKSLAAAINPVTLAKRAWALAQAALNLVMSANPIAMVVLALGALAAGVKFAYDNFEGFRVLVDGVFVFLRNVFGPVLGWLGDRFGDLARAVGLSSSQSKTAATESFAGMSTEVTASTTAMATGVKADVKKIEDFVPAAFARMKAAGVADAKAMETDTVLAAMGMSVSVREKIAEMVTGVTGKTAEQRDQIVWDMQTAKLQATLRAAGMSEDVVKAIDGMVFGTKVSMEEMRKSAVEKLEKVHEAAAAQREKLEAAGANSARAFAEAMERDSYLAYRAGERLGLQAAAGANAALIIQSPSKVFAEIGRQTIDGFIQGIEERGPLANRALVGFVGSLKETLARELAQAQTMVATLGRYFAPGAGAGMQGAIGTTQLLLQAHGGAGSVSAAQLRNGPRFIHVDPATGNPIPIFHTGGTMPWDGLADLKRGERITPARGGGDRSIAKVITKVFLDGREIATAIGRPQWTHSGSSMPT